MPEKGAAVTVGPVHNRQSRRFQRRPDPGNVITTALHAMP